MAIDETLTVAERAAPFQIGEGRDAAPSGPTRLPTITDDFCVHVVDMNRGIFVTVDPATGEELARGNIEQLLRAA
jgi:hypothetical protein